MELICKSAVFWLGEAEAQEETNLISWDFAAQLSEGAISVLGEGQGSHCGDKMLKC